MSPPVTIVVDIEGTCSPIEAVREQLFGYARARYRTWIEEASTPAELDAISRLNTDCGGDSSNEALLGRLVDWTDRDVKSPILKDIQGQIWQVGFASGQLIAPVYPDAARCLRRWADNQQPIYVYSSGSVEAQRAWFAHTDHGDLTGTLRGYFDLVNAGPKKDPASYRRIAAMLGRAGGDILFLTDLSAELAAAETAGWATQGIYRPGNPAPQDSDRVWLTTFDDVLAPAR